MKKGKYPELAPIAAVSVFFVLVAVAGWLVLVAPQRSHAKKLGAQIQTISGEIVTRQAALAAAHHHTEAIQTADLFRLEKAMPDEVDMPGILLQLSQVARQTGIQFQSISPDPATTLTGYQVVPINLIFQGNFYDLADFIYRLRNLVVVKGGDLTATGRLFSVDTLDFAEGENKFPQIQATLTVDAYVYGSATPVIAPPAAGSTDTSDTSTTDTTTTSPSTPLPPTSATAAGASN